MVFHAYRSSYRFLLLAISGVICYLVYTKLVYINIIALIKLKFFLIGRHQDGFSVTGNRCIFIRHPIFPDYLFLPAKIKLDLVQVKNRCCQNSYGCQQYQNNGHFDPGL